MNGKKYIYFFGGDVAEGNKEMKDLLGGKGSNLSEMTSIGIPVPPGFTLSTEACAVFNELEGDWPEGLEDEVRLNIAILEELTGKKLGSCTNPLLVSVRSGAAVSMPGMMDTVLNLGLNKITLNAIAEKSGNIRFAWDSYRRFIQMFGDVVMNVPHHDFEEILQEMKDARGVDLDTQMSSEDLEELVNKYFVLYENTIGSPFPEDPWEQLRLSVNAVFGSWNNDRAIKYRKLNDIKGLIGTAVNVQTMVFGNLGDDSGTGVCFTRNPSNGENKFYGEYLMNAQGEDVVAGIRTPLPISTLEDVDPVAYAELIAIREKLEAHYKDVQDIEFTLEDGKLYILQTRTGKRTIFAALNIAMDMEDEGLIDAETAVQRVPASEFPKLFAPVLNEDGKKAAVKLTSGLNASPGGACGLIAFSANEAEEMEERGEAVILCRKETSPEDIGGMAVSKGILTSRGGMTSHAAVVARGMGVPCVAGAGDLVINSSTKTITCGDVTLGSGDVIAIDGFTGEVFAGEVKVSPSEILQISLGDADASDSILFKNYSKLMKWTDEYRRLGVRTNAETPNDTKTAVAFGAEGIGLCRTEHMFFEGDRITSFRRLILVAEEVKGLRDRMSAGDPTGELAKKLEEPLKEYDEALAELLPVQREDFEGIFRVLNGLPCTVRLLDPPLHEFLPHDEAGQEEVAEVLGVTAEKVRTTIEKLHEFNPMLGHRGCRLGLTYPEISDMQVRAIIEAALNCFDEGIPVLPEIMIPLVGHPLELKICRERAQAEIDKVFAERGKSPCCIDYKIGTMIEIPRACIAAGEIAEHAEFYSFGTNDLTQMGCGFSRDDAGKFLGDYVKMGIYERDPFASIDQAGIGGLVTLAVDRGRKAKPDLKIGVCGEHGGDPDSIEFFDKAGLNYVSCSPYRVPIARLAAAQVSLRERSGS